MSRRRPQYKAIGAACVSGAFLCLTSSMWLAMCICIYMCVCIVYKYLSIKVLYVYECVVLERPGSVGLQWLYLCWTTRYTLSITRFWCHLNTIALQRVFYFVYNNKISPQAQIGERYFGFLFQIKRRRISNTKYLMGKKNSSLHAFLRVSGISRKGK